MRARPKANADFGIVVFGKDEAGKPHASMFTMENAELAMKAARLMAGVNPGYDLTKRRVFLNISKRHRPT